MDHLACVASTFVLASFVLGSGPMSFAITVRGLNPSEKSWLKAEAKEAGSRWRNSSAG